MFESLNNRLSVIREEIREKEKLESLLHQHQKDLESLYLQLPPLEAELNKEAEDVKRLESFSFSSLILTLFGDLEDYLLEEQQELAACRMRYDETCKSIRRLEDRIDILNEKLAPYSDTECLYRQMMSAKEALILEAHHPCEMTIACMTKERDATHGILAELEKSLSICNRILCSIENIGSTLTRASKWKDWDVYNGAQIASKYKCEELDRAQAQARDIQDLLIGLKAELSSIPNELDLFLTIDDHTRFMDAFLGNLISDLWGQNEIDRSIEQVREIKKAVGTLRNQLQNAVRDHKRKLDDLCSQLSDTICTAN